MDKIVLKNGIKLLYERVPGDITSFTIGFEAGANEENADELGLAHVVEHMVFKGTDRYTEKEINDLSNKYFGFHNAMTNYPYAVYYASSLKEDFEEGFNLYSDIVFHPSFCEEGFEEEIAVILEELKEWSDDAAQHCEDKIFYNSFCNRRIRNLIIGESPRIKSFSVEDVKKFHKEKYKPENCVVSVVTSMELDEVIRIVEKPVSDEVMFAGVIKENDIPLYENPVEGVYREVKEGISGCKVQYIFPIHELDREEITMLHLFNEYFASGTSSILYEEIRTKRGLVYDIRGSVKAENGIKLYSISLSTSKENLDEVMNIIDESIESIRKLDFDDAFFIKYLKSQKTKRMLAVEKSIVMAMHLAVYEIMYGDGELLLNEFNMNPYFNNDNMKAMIDKLFKYRAVQILESGMQLP